MDTSYPAARIGDLLFRGSGTPQAAAVVSGAAALLISQRPNLTPDQVKALLHRDRVAAGRCRRGRPWVGPRGGERPAGHR
jgi:subtilisin family serine protease